MIAENFSERVPLVIGLTTLPSRIASIRPTLESLLSQTLVPDRILLAIPDTSFREQETYNIPSWLEEFDSVVEIVRCERDWGPGTKLVGNLPAVVTPSCLILVDDDLTYKPFMCEMLYKAILNSDRCAYSFYVYPCGPINVGQGADAFAMNTRYLNNLQIFAESMMKSRHLRVVDDLWISAFLMSKGIQVKSLKALIPDGGLIYKTAHNINQLHDLEGDMERDRAMSIGLDELLIGGHLGLSRKLISMIKLGLQRIIAFKSKSSVKS